MTDATDTLDAWHFLGPARTLAHGDGRAVTVGTVFALPEGVAPVPCQTGFHASVRLLDALRYASGTGLVLCRVRLGGTILRQEDKVVASRRTVLAMADADPLLHDFACWAAEAALWGQSWRGFYNQRSVDAIAVKRAWVRGEATDADLAAARAATWAAATTRAATQAAASDAARDAAEAAALAAAWAGAWAGAWNLANAHLEHQAYALLGLEGMAHGDRD